MLRITTKIRVIGAALVLSGLPLLSQTEPRPASRIEGAASAPAAIEKESDIRTSYILGPDDQIVIRAINVPDMTEKPMRVGLNGEITIPMVGHIRAAGLTTQQFEAELVKRLKVYLEEPDVAVTIAEFRSQPVSIIGEVGTPGVHQLEGRKTLVEILSTAGGLRAEAGPSIRISRQIEQGRIPLPGATDDPTGRFSVAEVEIKPLMAATSPEKNIVILPHDVISIPRAEAVFVMGDVGKMGPILLSEGHSISVLRAVSSSGGLLRTAAPNNAKILRPIPGSTKWSERPVDIKKILKGQAEDQTLLAGDILFVPDSISKRVTARTIEAMIQVATLAGTYSVIR